MVSQPGRQPALGQRMPAAMWKPVDVLMSLFLEVRVSPFTFSFYLAIRLGPPGSGHCV